MKRSCHYFTLSIFISFLLHSIVFVWFATKTNRQEEIAPNTPKTPLSIKLQNNPSRIATAPQTTNKQQKPQTTQTPQSPTIPQKPSHAPEPIATQKQKNTIIEEKKPLNFPLPTTPIVTPPKPLEAPQEQKNPKIASQQQQNEPKKPPIDSVTQSYLELYKNDFDSFEEETKVYLLKNLKDIGKITERFLIYPYISVQAKQHGIAIIEFILYPNGKINDPKIIKSSGFYILDDNTEETIQKAYKNYPPPDKPTIIRIYVKYQLI